jgi:hypothetical protein
MTTDEDVIHSSFVIRTFVIHAMSSPAQVRSVDAIEAFSLALARFAERVGASLDALDAQLRRADAWIDHDRPSHWRNQTHEAENQVHQAKLELERCLLMTTVDGQRPACREQKAALEAARARLDYCREKVDMVKKWQRNFRHESMEYRGRVGQLRRIVEQDAPNARALLAKLMQRIEEYQLERPPEGARLSSPGATSAESTTRAVQEPPAAAATPAQPVETES